MYLDGNAQGAQLAYKFLKLAMTKEGVDHVVLAQSFKLLAGDPSKKERRAVEYAFVGNIRDDLAALEEQNKEQRAEISQHKSEKKEVQDELERVKDKIGDLENQ